LSNACSQKGGGDSNVVINTQTTSTTTTTIIMPIGSSGVVVQAVLGCVLVAVVLLAHGAHGQTALGSWKTGRSTFYTDIDQGNCGFGALSSTKFPYRYIAGTAAQHICFTYN
jgi:hypothetical protein